MEQYAARQSHEMMDYLLKRRSVMAKNMQDPAPNTSQIDNILAAAARVPDHGKLAPWHFMVFQGQNRVDVGQKIAQIYATQNPEATQAHRTIEEERFTRAPLVIGVISRVKDGKVPMWEQVLSAGASCMNMVLAANACGFAAQWLTEWYAYDETFKSYLGLDKRDNIAGFIHIGTPILDEELSDRPRPDRANIVTYWEEGTAINKGDQYGMPKYGLPVSGFHLPKA